MDWIIENVAIGNYLEAQDGALLRTHGIRSVLSLDGSLTVAQVGVLGVAEIAAHRLEDGEGNDLQTLVRAVDSLGRLASLHAPVLVQCHAGRSRSVVVVAGYLMRTLGLDADSAVAAIAAKREINVSPALTKLLYRLEG